MNINSSPNTPYWIHEYFSQMLDLYFLSQFYVELNYIEPGDDRFQEGVYADTVPNSIYERVVFNVYASDLFSKENEDAKKWIEHEVLELFLDYRLLSLVTAILMKWDATGTLSTMVQLSVESTIQSLITIRRKGNV